MRTFEIPSSSPASLPPVQLADCVAPVCPADMAQALVAAPKPLPKEILGNLVQPKAPILREELSNGDCGPTEPWKIHDWLAGVQKSPMACLDTETTNLGGVAVEVGVVGEDGKLLYHAYVQPLEPVSPEAAKIHGLTAEFLADKGRPWSEVAPELREVLHQHPTVLQYSFNFFDRTVLERTDELANLKQSTVAGVKWVDVMTPYQHANGLYKGMKLTEAAKDLGVDLYQAHGAGQDAAATMGVFQALAGRHLELKTGEFLLHQNPKGLLGGYDMSGHRLDIDPESLQRALDRALATWEKPERGVQSLENGAYIRVNLPPKPGFEHLSPVPAGSVHLAWHKQKDVQAVRLPNGNESLFLDGQEIALHPLNHHSPTQIVINLAHCSGRIEFADHMRAYKDLR